MTLNKNGYFEEEVINSHVELSPLLEFVSPNLNSKVNEDTLSKNLFSKLDEINFHKDIGYYLNLYAGHDVEGEFRNYGSSGEMTTWILKEFFERKFTDGIIQVKKSQSSTQSLIFEYGVSKQLKKSSAAQNPNTTL
jgi:coenzyme F420 hydrogenase subunit beta